MLEADEDRPRSAHPAHQDVQETVERARARSDERSRQNSAATNQRVIVCEAELQYARRHFLLPRDLLLDLIERVLTRPTAVYADNTKAPREYRLFYRLEDGRYIVAVVKVVSEGAFFAGMYPTGRHIRGAHRKFKRLL